MNALTIRNLHKSFGETKVIKGVNFDVMSGETVCILGPSGCGKSTILFLIAGIENPDRGEILWNGKSLAGIPTHRRNFGLMFQDFALFPHKNVFENVAFGLNMDDRPKDEIRRRVHETLDLVGLPGFDSRDVNNLSGGEAQRVAMARSLAPDPRLLMLDEPLGSLDRNLRERLALDLKNILKSSGKTAIYVTHDQEEAFVLSDRVVIINAGQVEQFDSPQKVYRTPGSVFTARFLGLNNLFPGFIKREGDLVILISEIGKIPVQSNFDGDVTVLLRPDSVKLGPGNEYQTTGEVSDLFFRGANCNMSIKIGSLELSFEFTSNQPLPGSGEKITISFNPQEAIQIFQENIKK